MRSSVLILCIALFAASYPASAQDLRSVPLDHWAYEYADALLLRHPELESLVWFSNRPWTQGDFLDLVAGLEESGLEIDRMGEGWADAIEREFGAPRDAVDSLDFYNAVGVEIAADLRTDHASFEPAFREPTFDEDRGEPTAQGLVRHDFAVQRSDNFLLGWRYVVDQNVRNDPTRRSKGQRGTDAAFDVLDAYALFRAGPLWLTVGRQQLSMGPGRGASLFVSDSIPALDHVRFEVRADPVRFTGLLAQLSRERPNRLLDEAGDPIPGSFPSTGDPVPFDVTRWLYLHRFDWRVHERLELSIGEAALVTGVDRGVELRYANPLLPFFIGQTEADETDQTNVNIVVHLDGAFRGPGRTRFHGAVFVQEFFIDADKREEIGNQLAWRVGMEWGDPLSLRGTTIGAEYSRVDVFTYLHRGLNTNWTTYGVPIGSSLGPDADQGTVWLERWIAPELRLTADLAVRRGGARSVETLESVTDAGNPPFPSGAAQRELRVGLAAWGRWPDAGLEGRVRLGRRAVEHIANDPGRDGEFWEASLGVSYRWRIQ